VYEVVINGGWWWLAMVRVVVIMVVNGGQIGDQRMNRMVIGDGLGCGW